MARRASPPRGVARPPTFLAAALAALLVLRATSDHDGGGGGEESAAEAPALVPNDGDASAPPPVTDGGARVLFELDSLARARVEVTGDTIELGNRSEESVPLGGSLTADVRCANTSVGAVDGVRLIDANMVRAIGCSQGAAMGGVRGVRTRVSADARARASARARGYRCHVLSRLPPARCI